MSSNRYFSNPFSSSLLDIESPSSHTPPQREDASVSKEYLFRKAYQLFQKCCSYYEHHVPPNTDTTGGTLTRRMDARYIGSLYIGGLGPCAYLAWKLASSPYLYTQSSDISITITNQTLRQNLLQHALNVVNDSLQYHQWDYPRITLLEGPVVGALVLKCLILQSLQKDQTHDNGGTSTRPSSSSASSSLQGLDVEIQKSKQDLLQIASIVRALDENQCEVLYGRAGYLLAISFLIQQGLFSQATTSTAATADNESEDKDTQGITKQHPLDTLDSTCLPTIDAILQEIISNGRQVALEEKFLLLTSPQGNTDETTSSEEKILPLVWKWHESFYLGAAHGMCGILYTILCFYRLVLDIPTQPLIATWIQETIHGLDHFCFPSNNLISSIDPNWNSYVVQQKTSLLLSPQHDRLVHWCHGATGHVLLLIKAYEVFQEEKYLFQAQDIARRVIFPRGLLKKGVGLCHGISGNAYALLALHRATVSWNRNRNPDSSQGIHTTEWLNMAVNFAIFALEHLDELAEVPDRPYSLFEGMAGLSSLLIDLCEPHRADFPFDGSTL